MIEPAWRKSSRSTTQGGECVEVASLRGAIGIRDSKGPDAGHVVLSLADFDALLGRIKSGELAV